MDILVCEIDRGLAREHMKAHDMALATEHYDRYISNIKKFIEKEPDNEDYVNRLEACIKEYNESLFKEARDAFNTQNWIRTMAICRKLLENEFGDPSVYKFLSFCYKSLKQQDIRIEFIKKYADLRPDDREINKLLGEAYMDFEPAQNAKKALELFEKHLEMAPNDDYIWNLLGHIYATHIRKDTRQIDKQLECFNKAHELNPSNPIPLKNIAMTYTRARMEGKAREIYKLLLDKYKKHLNNDDLFCYAAMNLRFGDYKTGWEYYEHRFNYEKKSNEDRGVFYPKFEQPCWDGKKNIKDSTLLVYMEQGLGDNIMFMRFAKTLVKYAKNVIAVVPDQIYPLFWESNLPFDVYPSKHPTDKLEFDYHIAVMSIPYALKFTPTNIPDREGYLAPNPDRVKAYKKTFLEDNNKFKIGINFEGGASGKEVGRDIAWEKIRIFAEIPDVQVYCFNKEISQSQMDKMAPGANVICLGHSFHSFADTAAGLMNMDYVVSTDNCIMNLSASLGLETLGLLNFDYEYRWYNAESGSVPWYATLKTIVNEVQNEWDPTIQKAVEEIKRIMAERYYK